MVHLLKTKVRRPPKSPNHTMRPRLVEKIEKQKDTPIVLISAPAGFGKTSCLLEWASILQERAIDVVWYALDEQDNDPAQFATYLMHAFEILDTDIFSFAEQGHPNLQAVTTHILNTVGDNDTNVVLMLDDYHLITTPQVHDALNRMCDYLPPNMRLVIGTRADPPLQLARLRSQGRITEIRMGDLQLKQEEMLSWLKTSLNYSPSNSVLEQLENVTEGWAASLALIIMILKHDTDEVNEDSLFAQLEGYSKTQRLVFDYFAEEVLEQQPPEIKQFLLDTCVLKRLYSDLCTSLTRNPSAGLILNQLATESLFVVSLSDTEPIYRYHHLFQHFLQQLLQLKDNNKYFEQHRLAADWYVKHDDIVEAIHHALQAEDYTLTAKLIAHIAWERLTSQGRIMTLIRWLTSIPDDIITDYPRLCLYYSRALYLIGDLEKSQFYVQQILETLKTHSQDIPEQHTLQAIALNYQATLTAYHGNLSEALSINQIAMNLDAELDRLDRVRIVNTTAYIHYLKGHVKLAQSAYEQALQLAQDLDHDYLILDAHYYLAQLDIMAGQLHHAKKRCKSVLAQYEKQITPLSAILYTLATIHYEENQVIEAEAMLRDAIALAQRGQISDVLWMAYARLGEMLAIQGKADDAIDCLHTAKQITNPYQSVMMSSHISATEARIMLNINQLENAMDWVRTFQESDDVEYADDFEQLIVTRIFLTQGKYLKALPLLKQIIDEAQTHDRLTTLIEAEILCALAHQALHQINKAQTSIIKALELAQSQGYVRLFLDIGESIHTLLSFAMEHDLVANYAEHLLDLAQRADNMLHPADQLTDREIEVLEQIARGLSNQDIANTLFISIGTVKSHIHHIMNKLDAQNRTEAVNKARSLNILKDST